jgi:tetratricopeptide (TPR) repeat protein
MQDYGLALSAFEKANQLKPNEPASLYNIGYVYRLIKEYQMALDYFDKAIKANPDYVLAYNGMAVVYAEKGNHSKAIGYYNKSLRIDPTNAESHNGLGIIYTELKQNKKAIACFNNAIEADSFCNQARVNLGYLYFNTDFERASEVLPLNEKLKINDESDPDEVYEALLKYAASDEFNSGDLVYDTTDLAFWSNDVDENTTEDSGQLTAQNYYNTAVYYSVLENYTEAFKYLNLAFENGFRDIEFIRNDDNISDLRDQPGFEALVKTYFKE